MTSSFTFAIQSFLSSGPSASPDVSCSGAGPLMSSISALVSSSSPVSCLITLLFSSPCSTPIMSAVAVPLGNFSFSLIMTSLLKGTAKSTPKNATPIAQTNSFHVLNLNGPPSSGFSRYSSAGMPAPKPLPNCRPPTLQAPVCTSTFSTGVKGSRSSGRRALKNAKPMRAEGIAIPDTHPVCRPKYMFEKHIRTPMTRPTSRLRIVKFCGALARSASAFAAALEESGGASRDEGCVLSTLVDSERDWAGELEPLCPWSPLSGAIVARSALV